MGNQAPASEENGVPQPSLLEAILDRGNLERAWQRVRTNKGKPGMDGMSVAAFPAFARANMPRIIEWIREGRYKPAPVKRVWIPKPDGTKRPLGVPTVLDRVIQLGKYLRSGVRHGDGSTEKTERGVPQGGPLSPLLANVMLDPLDKTIEAMGLPFARYADDFLIVTRTKAEALAAMAQVEAYVEGRLKLLVNRGKSKVAPLGECDFLGFNIRGKRIRRTEKAAKRFKLRIQEVTSRSRGISMGQRLVELRGYCVGWFHYFKTGLPYAEVLQWDQWIRRRIRLCYWKDWKRPRKRRRMLIKLGISPEEVKLASRSRKGYWRMSSNSLVQIALNNDYLAEQGVPSMRELWVCFKYGDQAKT